MRLSLLLSLVPFLYSAQAADVKFLQSTSLALCQDSSNFTASLFNVIFTPNNFTATFDVVATTTLVGNLTFDVTAYAYGFPVIQKLVNGCDLNVPTLCPIKAGQFDLPGIFTINPSDVNQIPGIAYGFPDIDAVVKVQIYSNQYPGVSAACVEAGLSNGITVDQKGVSWATAVVAGLALVVSAIVSGLGHSTTAAHVATYALALFGFFQSQAIIGMVAVPQPPAMQAWTQNFQWSMGIIKVGFMQNMATWYLKSTGGTPSNILNTLSTVSVQVLKKRNLDAATNAIKRFSGLVKRSNNQNAVDPLTGAYVVRGMGRVAFRAGMEGSNLFFTGLCFFVIFILFTVIGVVLFKGLCEFMVRAKWMKGDKFEDFRNGWLIVLKGILFRMVLIGFPQIVILCMWEFTQVDSPGEVVLAVFFFFGMSFTLGWAAWKVIRIAKRSTALHKNPAYILYSDPNCLNKWGFLYIQFRATAYYYILPVLVYILVKGMFVGLGQQSGVAQAIALLIIEAVALIGASVYRPWMDKKTNTCFIAIAAISFVNSIILVLISGIFDAPKPLSGICGIFFFFLNAIFSLVLLIMVIVVTIMAIVRKNPDTRYQAMADDRASFIKSQTQLTTELDALGATARGDKGGFKHGLDLEDDSESWSSDSINQQKAQQTPLPVSTMGPREPPHSPISPSVPLFPSGGRETPTGREATSFQTNQNRPPVYQGALSADSRPSSAPRTRAASPYGRPNPSQTSLGGGYRAANNASPSPMGSRNQNSASPWQRGAGYDH